MAVIQIQVIADIVCAWCYIAKRNLYRAISLYQKTYPGGKSDTFELTWSPYYLNYNPHPYSVDKLWLADVRLANMTPDQRSALNQRMDKAGKAAGIGFKWGGKIGPSTKDAHRLIYLSRDRTREVCDALVEGLFEAYHCREEDISERAVLRRIAVEAGIDERDADAWLASDVAGSEVDELASRSKEMENPGVPVFRIQGADRIDGASDPMELMEAFVAARETQM